MNYNGNKAENVKIAYIGGGSRGWAWGLMSDLAIAGDMSGDVYLYDIDYKAACDNEIIGNMYNDLDETTSKWNYKAVETIGEALTGADFVVISILPGTFDEMESDVHTPEKYGIYQSVGDTSGPGGIVRAMRTVPMFKYIAKKVEKYSPDAWVINYTNPMTLCVKALYNAFPQIKAFGCCHEIYGTQRTLVDLLKEKFGFDNIDRREIKVNCLSVNHFTWLTEAKYRNIDLIPHFKEACDKYMEGEGVAIRETMVDDHWMNSHFSSGNMVKMDLFRRFGYIAAAGDRHLAEFCPGKWYLENPERVEEMHFELTTVKWRKDDLKSRLERAKKLISGEEKAVIKVTGEEGVNQMRALLGLSEIVTNVNIPNKGQIPNLPLGAVVETNAVFSGDSIRPVLAGEIPKEIYPLISKICAEQEAVADAIEKRDVNKIFEAFAGDPLVTCSLSEAKEMFCEMVLNTKKYLDSYDLSVLEELK